MMRKYCTETSMMVTNIPTLKNPLILIRRHPWPHFPRHHCYEASCPSILCRMSGNGFLNQQIVLLAAGGSTVISDVVAGVFLANDTDFSVGDEVIVGVPEASTQGIVESMDVRRTRLRDKNGILHVIPNSVVERKEWVVLNKKTELTPLGKAAIQLKKRVEERRERVRKNAQ